MTVKNGTLSIEGATPCVFVKSGNLVVDNVVCDTTYKAVVVAGGTMTIDSMIATAPIIAEGGKLTINDGSMRQLKVTGGEIVVNGGSFVATTNNYLMELDGGVITINGGSFKFYNSNYGIYFRDYTNSDLFLYGGQYPNGLYAKARSYSDLSVQELLRQDYRFYDENGKAMSLNYLDKQIDTYVSIGTASPGTPTYKVTYNLTNLTSSNTSTTMNKNSSLITNLTAKEGYVLPSSITVTMDGKSMTNYTYSDGLLMIMSANITGDLVITATAEEDPNNVATVTINGQTTSYATVQAAVDVAAVSGSTVTLLHDVTLDAPVSCTTGTFAIDLAGYTLANTSLSDVYALYVDGADVTVSNGTLLVDGLDPCIYVQSGNVIVNDVDANSRSKAVVVAGGTMTINHLTANVPVIVEGGKLTINDGSMRQLKVAGGEMVVNGGSFAANSNFHLVYLDGGDITINGGSFKTYNSSYSIYFNDSYESDIYLNGGIFTNGLAFVFSKSGVELGLTNVLGDGCNFYDDNGNKLTLTSSDMKIDSYVAISTTSPGPRTYNLSYNLSNLTPSDPSNTLSKNHRLITYLNPVEGYAAPTSITVTMNGKVVTNYSYSNGLLMIMSANITGDIEITAAAVEPVATVEVQGKTTGYATLQAAFDAAVSSGLVTLLCDVELDAPVSFPAGTMTFDLAGYTLSNTTGNVLYANGGNMTVKNGTLRGAYQGTNSCVWVEGGDVTLNGVVCERGNQSVTVVGGSATIQDITVDDTIYVEGGKLTINGGSMQDLRLNGGETIVNGGNFSTTAGNVSLMYLNGGNITVNGGTWKAPNKCGIYLANALSDVTINGGTFPGGLQTFVFSTSVEFTLATTLGNGVKLYDDNGNTIELDYYDTQLDGYVVAGTTSPGPRTYTVTYNLTNLTSSNTSTTLGKNSSLFATLIPAEGYVAPSRITITMDGKTVTDYSYTPSTGLIWITGANVTGDIVITAVGQDAATQPTLTVKSVGLSLKDEVYYSVYFNAEYLSGVYEMGLLGFNTQNLNGTIENADSVIPGTAISGQYYVAHSNGIPAKNLGDEFYFKVYAKLSDGTYVYSDMKSYNAVKYANTILSNTSSNAKLKAVVVAMLNYGAAAQVQFDYKTDSLMNAGLTAEQKALVKAYDESMVAPVITVDNNKAANFVNNGASKRNVSISLKGAFAINYYLTASMAVDSGMTLYYWTEADYKAATKLTTANATNYITMEATGNANEFKAAVAGISAKQIDETIFVVGVYESDGVTYSTGVVAYSLGKYCEQQAAGSNATLAAMAQATAVYGYYAKAYFGN